MQFVTRKEAFAIGKLFEIDSIKSKLKHSVQLLHQRASCRRRNEEETCCPRTVAICYCFSLVLFAFWPTDKQASGGGEGGGAARAECQEERSKPITWQRDRRPCYLTLDTQLLAGVPCSYQCYDRFLFLTKLSSKTFCPPSLTL